jgi:hypothetical protein
VSTKTITITDPKDFQAGDLYYGTYVRPNRPAIKTVVDGGTLTLGADGKRLYVETLGGLRYVDITTEKDDLGYWEGGYATREVEEPDLPSKQGIWLYYSYGLDEDGDLSHFPNLILHLDTDPELGWYNVGNSSASGYPMKPEEVRAALPRMAALTLKEDKK